MGWNPVKDMKKLFGKFKDEVKNSTDKFRGVARWWEGQIVNVAKKGKNEIEGVSKKGVREVGEVTGKGVDQIEKAAGKAIDQVGTAVEDKLQDLSEAFSKKVLKAAAKEVKEWRADMDGFRKEDPELVDAIDALGFELSLSCVTLDYEGFYERSEKVVEILDNLASNPPSVRRRPIIAAVEALGPTSVDLGISAEFALGVGTDALGGGFRFKAIQMKLFTRLGDRVLKRLGVPE